MTPENAEQPQGQGTYQVLARRTRPQAFSELVGQDVVSTALASMISSGVIPHAFLFTGTRGTGKTSSARILAKSLCCVNGPTSTPCQTCVHCRQITECAHDDVLEIDGASNTGVDHVRDLRESARFYPNSARYKVFIIDEVHMLTQQAFNALLKTLEEPPPQVVFILATTELHKVPLTVRSRCVTFSFRKVAPETIASHLARILEREGVAYEADALALIAREAKGSIRDSLSLLEQVRALCGGRKIETLKTREALSILGQEMAEQLLSSIVAGNAADALGILRNADAASMDLSLLLDDTAALFRSALVLRLSKNDDEARRLTQLLPSEMAFLRDSTAPIPSGALSEIFRVLSLGSREVGRAAAGLPWAEIFIMDCITRRDWLSASELVGLLSQKKKLAPETSSEAGIDFIPAPRHGERPQALSVDPLSLPSGSTPDLPLVPTSPASAAGNFQAVVKVLEGKNIRLANKLKQAALVRCDDNHLEFAGGEQNRFYTTLNATEAQTFLEALQGCGLGHLEIKGLHMPSDVRKAPAFVAAAPASAPSRGASTDASRSIGMARPLGDPGVSTGFKPPQARPQSEPRPSTPPATPPPRPLPMQNLAETGTPVAAPPNPAPERASTPHTSIHTVADLEKSERMKAEEEKRLRILRDPRLQELISFGSDARVLPLEDEALN